MPRHQQFTPSFATREYFFGSPSFVRVTCEDQIPIWPDSPSCSTPSSEFDDLFETEIFGDVGSSFSSGRWNQREAEYSNARSADPSAIDDGTAKAAPSQGDAGAAALVAGANKAYQDSAAGEMWEAGAPIVLLSSDSQSRVVAGLAADKSNTAEVRCWNAQRYACLLCIDRRPFVIEVGQYALPTRPVLVLQMISKSLQN